MNLPTLITLLLTTSFALGAAIRNPDPDVTLDSTGSLVLDADLHLLPAKILTRATTNT